MILDILSSFGKILKTFSKDQDRCSLHGSGSSGTRVKELCDMNRISSTFNPPWLPGGRVVGATYWIAGTIHNLL